MIILLMHIGTDMKMPYRITEENAQGLPFIDKVDAIISAHSHELVLDKIKNIPIIQAGYLFHPRGYRACSLRGEPGDARGRGEDHG